MKAPEGIKLIESELSTYWLDENGILCSIVKSVPFTIERMDLNFKVVSEITGNKRVCVLVDLTHALPVEKAARVYAAGIVSNYYKAMAFVSPSPFTRIIGNAFIALAGAPIPTRQFKTEEGSKEWLMRYLPVN